MRTHPNKQLKFPEYDRLSAATKAKWETMINKDHVKRTKLLEMKRCFPLGERGINLRGLPAESRIPQMIAVQDWEYFVRTPEPYDERVVRLFYRNMIPAVYHSKYTVMVEGKQVRISLDDISEYHLTPRRADLGMHYGMSNSREFKIKENPVIARALRRNGESGWNRTKDEITKADMHYDMAFLLLWIRSSLKPSTHNTVADPQVAHVLYSLQQGYPMSAAHLMWMEILDAGMSLDGVLPFPCMITHFCRNAGVEIGELTDSMGDFGKKHYKIQINSAARKEKEQATQEEEEEEERERLIEEMQENSDYNEEEYNELDPEYEQSGEEEPNQEEEEHTGDTPPWMRRINVQWQHQFDDINWRLDQLGAPSVSERRNVRKRSEGGASSSRHG